MEILEKLLRISEEYKNKMIYYSLGNFVFDQYFNSETMKGLAIEVNIDENKKLINIPKRRSSFAKKRNQLMLAVIDRDGYKCQHCGIDKSLTVDHILALSIGGSDDIENLQLLCRPCNSRKNDK